MKAAKVILIILAILLFIGGLYCFFSPAATFASLAPVVAILTIIDAIGSICTWNERRKAGMSDGWSLAGAIVSIIVAVLILGSFAAQFVMDTLFVYIVVAWLIVVGIIRIANSLKLRKLRKAAPEGSGIGSGWGFVLAMGIIMVLMGIFGFFNPLTIALAMGLMIGLCIMVAAISMFSLALAL